MEANLNIRSLYFLLIFGIGYSACSPKQENLEKATNRDGIPTIITGQIKGGFWNTIRLRIGNDFREYQSYSCEFDSSDRFYFRFKARWPNRFTLRINKNNRFEGVYLPGDSVFIDGELSRSKNEFLQKLKFSGTDTSHYAYYRRKGLNEHYPFIWDKFWEIKKRHYKEFLLGMDSLYKVRMELFVQDSAGLSLNPAFVQHETNTIYYTYLTNKLREPVLRLHLQYDSTEGPSDYYNFVSDLTIYDTSAVQNHEYYRFLDKVSYKMVQKPPIALELEPPVYPIVNRLNYFTNHMFQLADSLLSGQVKEFFLSKLVNNYLRLDLYTADSLIQELEKREYSNFILDEYRRRLDSLYNVQVTIPDTLLVSTTEDNKIKLKDTLTGYTYLGIWTLGCKGCIIDFQHKEGLGKKYRNTNINIISISLDSNTPSVHEFLNKYGDTGVHLFDINGEINALLNIKSIPRYFLIDNKGKIIKQFFYRPGDPKLEEYLDRVVVRLDS